MKSGGIFMKKVWFLKTLEISFLLFTTFFFLANSTQAQIPDYYPYCFGDYSNSFYQFGWGGAPWAAWPMDFQNYNDYGWTQTNIPSIYGSRLGNTNNFSYNQPSYDFAENGGFPYLSSISFNPATQMYSVPWLQYKTSFEPGSWIGTPDGSGNPWNVFLFQDMPVAYRNGTIQTGEGTSQAETITIEDDGGTFTFKPGEIFRIVLPMYDDIPDEDFGTAAWYTEGFESWYGQEYEDHGIAPFNANIYGFEPKTIDLHKEDGELIQENTYRGLWPSQNAKTLVFNYYRDDSNEIVDTFSVTIQIQGSGHYELSY